MLLKIDPKMKFATVIIVVISMTRVAVPLMENYAIDVVKNHFERKCRQGQNADSGRSDRCKGKGT